MPIRVEVESWWDRISHDRAKTSTAIFSLRRGRRGRKVNSCVRWPCNIDDHFRSFSTICSSRSSTTEQDVLRLLQGAEGGLAVRDLAPELKFKPGVRYLLEKLRARSAA